jgi:hypothetical protein
MAADGASVPGAAEADESGGGLPVAMMTPVDEASRTLALSSLALDLSPVGSFALSVSERLQLREQIRKAAQDIYSERAESPLQSEISHLQGAGILISP